MTTSWTEERVESLKEMWASGTPASLIAQMFGLSRNAVLGKVNRLGLQARRERKDGNRRSDGGSVAAVKAIVKHRRALADGRLEPDNGSVEGYSKLIASGFLGISFMGLEPGHCRFPQDIDGQTLFCGQPTLPNSSYCATCRQICYVKPPNLSDDERKRRAGHWVRINGFAVLKSHKEDLEAAA